MERKGLFYLITPRPHSITEGSQGKSLEAGAEVQTTEECLLAVFYLSYVFIALKTLWPRQLIEENVYLAFTVAEGEP